MREVVGSNPIGDIAFSRVKHALLLQYYEGFFYFFYYLCNCPQILFNFCNLKYHNKMVVLTNWISQTYIISNIFVLVCKNFYFFLIYWYNYILQKQTIISLVSYVTPHNITIFTILILQKKLLRNSSSHLNMAVYIRMFNVFKILHRMTDPFPKFMWPSQSTRNLWHILV